MVLFDGLGESVAYDAKSALVRVTPIAFCSFVQYLFTINNYSMIRAPRNFTHYIPPKIGFVFIVDILNH